MILDKFTMFSNIQKNLKKDYVHGWPEWNKESLSLPTMFKTIYNVVFIKMAKENPTKKGNGFQINFVYFLMWIRGHI